MERSHPKELRVVLHPHDSQGLGHTRGNLAIAHALAALLPEYAGRKVTGLLVTGESTATRFEIPAGWDWVVLPGIRKGDGGYRPRHLAIGQDTLVQLRAQLIDAVLSQFRPHLASTTTRRSSTPSWARSRWTARCSSRRTRLSRCSS